MVDKIKCGRKIKTTNKTWSIFRNNDQKIAVFKNEIFFDSVIIFVPGLHNSATASMCNTVC